MFVLFDRKFINCDQSMQMNWRVLKNTFYPFTIRMYGGKAPVQQERKTFTTIPHEGWDFENDCVWHGPCVVILKSKSTKEPYPGPSKQLIEDLKQLGLKVGFNEKYNVYITSSPNGWEQDCNVDMNLEAIDTAGPGTIVQLDNWKLFITPEFQESLVQQLQLPSLVQTFLPR